MYVSPRLVISGSDSPRVLGKLLLLSCEIELITIKCIELN